jgi:uncharacterized membrane protein
MKKIAGSILIGFGLMAQVLNEWARHFFYAAFNMAKGIMLEGGGSFTAPAMYSDPTMVKLSIGTRILTWVIIVFGFGLIVTDMDRKK